MSRSLANARRAVDSVQADPTRAHQLAESVLKDQRAEPAARATALWAMGLVSRERDQLEDARTTLERAIATAASGGDRNLEARIESSLALVLAYLGEIESALAATERAGGVLVGVDRARNQMQQGLLLQRKGDLEAAMGLYRSALTGLRRAGDEIAEVRLLLNRSVIHTYRGHLDKAINDLERGMGLARKNQQTLQLAACAHNLAWVHGRKGNFPSALELFDVAESSYLALDSGVGRPNVLSIDRAETLAAAGLLDEAWTVMRLAIETLEVGDNAVDLAEARLLAAQVALARNDTDNAVSLARIANEQFVSQGRTSWSLQSQAIAMRAGEIDLERAPRLVHELERMGWDVAAHQARFDTGRAALAVGSQRLGRELLGSVAKRNRGPAIMRAQARQAAALLDLEDGNPRAAAAELRRGQRLLIEHLATLGSAELRARAAATSRGLANLAVDLALGQNRAWDVFTAVESWRAVALHMPMVRPPRHRALATDLNLLRAVDAEMTEAERSSRPTAQLSARRAELERSVRQRSLRAQGVVKAGSSRVERSELNDQLGEAALVVYFIHTGFFHALTLAGRRLRMHRLAPVGPIEEALFAALFALHRLSLGQGSPASLEAAAASLADSSTVLSEGLLGPLVEIANRPLVIVPTGSLHRLPWLALPNLRSRPVSVAPSVSMWMLGYSRLGKVTPTSRALLCAGPGLATGSREVRTLARRYQRHELLTGKRATTAALIAGLAKAEVAHIACHGSFRSDNPLFSSLLMADGRLTIYDLEALGRAPGLMVLPACDAGVGAVLAGDELLGLAGAMLQLGSGSLVAPIAPVPDETTHQLMINFHEALGAGCSPAQAMAKATDALKGDDPANIAARSAFLVMGSG